MVRCNAIAQPRIVLLVCVEYEHRSAPEASMLMQDAVPSTLRKPVEPSRYVHMLSLRAHSTHLVAGPEARAAALQKSRFARLPHEPEDARLTGVTRSLNRRLLALNLPGTLSSLRKNDPKSSLSRLGLDRMNELMDVKIA
jgi:hypothetical protein